MHKKPFIVSSALYLLYFLGLFLQFPLTDSLPGHADTLYNLAIFNDYGNRITAFFTGDFLGKAYYPVKFYQAFSELYLGEAAIYLPFHFLGMEDMWAYYCFIVILYALNGSGAFLFFRYFKFSNILSFIGGLAFASSAFAFSQIELLNGIPYFFFFLSIISFSKYLDQKKSSDLYWAAFFAGIELYFSAYIMVYALTVFGVLLVRKWRVLQTPGSFFVFFKATLIISVLIAPYSYVLYFYGILEGGYSVIQFDNIHRFSIQISDLVRPMPNNLLYEDFFPTSTSDSFRMVSYGFTGWALWVLTLISFFKPSSIIKSLGFILLLLGICFSIGPYLEIGQYKIPGPLFLFYKYTDLSSVLRIPARAYSLVILGMLSLSLYVLHIWIQNDKKWSILAYIFIVLFLVENVPFKFHHNHFASQLDMPASMEEALQEIPGDAIILTLPSSLFSGKGYTSSHMSEHSREELFTYWQSIHKKNTINGISSFMSDKRGELNDILLRKDWDTLLDSFRPDYIFFLKEMTINEGEALILPELRGNDKLLLQHEDKQLVIFKADKK